VVTSILFASWSISGVELTLAWNSVSDVYAVQSTGQIIALVVGFGVLVKVLWLLRHGEVRGAVFHSPVMIADTSLQVDN
jgi:divalent metal cation (Fe/Co/Zn/Cd) transporter